VSGALLCRVAESLFWLGRYVERAEGTARILEVGVFQALEQSGGAGESAAARLLAVMGLLPDTDASDTPATLWEVTERLAQDPTTPSSIAGCISAARENARSVRHVIPVELWERLNATWHELPHQWALARHVGPASFLAYVKTQSAAISGLAEATMSRDQTWLFFTLGRCLERTDVVARQLATVSFEDASDAALVTLLRSCGGYEPYLRLRHGVVEAEEVVAFLLRDRRFPRSALASLSLASDCLEQLAAGRLPSWDEARARVGLAIAELEFSAPSQLSADLDGLLARLERVISEVSASVGRQYFTDHAPTAWCQGAEP
jgi:uncharacterized alpha-E superfamily protein